MRGFCPGGGGCPRGFCPRGFCPEGFCPTFDIFLSGPAIFNYLMNVVYF